MGKFRIQLVFIDEWRTKFTFEKNTVYSTTSEEWILLISDFTETKIGMRLYYDDIDGTFSDLCFSIIMITHSVL